MLSFFTAIGVLLSVLLLYFNAGKHKAVKYLGFFFQLLSLYTLVQYILLYVKSTFFVALFFVNPGFLCFLAGPMIYWYVRSVVTNDPHLKKSDLIHFLPAAIFLAGSIPYILTPWSYKMQVASSLTADPGFLGNFNATFLHSLLSPAVVFISRPALILGYTLWAAGLLLQQVLKNKTPEVFSRRHLLAYWLLSLLIFLVLTTSSHLILLCETFYLRDLNRVTNLNLLQAITIVSLTGLMVLPFFFPSLLYGVVEQTIHEHKQIPEFDTNDCHPEKAKARGRLDPEYLRTLGIKADSCMSETAPYLEPGFNLIHLSEMMHIPLYHLECYFRVNKQSFTDYRNHWRIEYAKKLILEGKNKVNTLEAIGLQSGFANRNTFFTAFKKTEGCSPRSFAAKSEKESTPPD